ncbi:MAG: GDSL-type esterase/lipase family protein [Rikenellaceae bacterium]
MEIKKNIVTLLCVMFAMPLFSQTKVACIGNSITFGTGVVNRELNSYPAQLQGYLGEVYEIANFGVSGTTVLLKGDKPYMETEQFKKSLEFNPDIIFIKLGTNDSKEHNIKYIENFKNDYQALINSYLELNPKVRIILVTPVRCYITEGDKINDTKIREKIVPEIEKLAYDNVLEIFDSYYIFGEDYVQSLFPDKIHPSSNGTGIMAANFYRYLTMKRDNIFNVFKLMPEGQSFNFHGYLGKLYMIDDVQLKVVQPKVANKERKWILRARFWDYEPQLDIKLLELGYHIVYFGVENLYGSNEALKHWDDVYKRMTFYGLSETLALEGMGRGGLPVYNWAAKNTKYVSAIYADAPVMDLKSWPMGEGESAGSEEDTERMLKAYGMKSKADMLKYKKNPIDLAKIFAKSKTPILHVVGEDDIVVPVKENTDVFAKRLRAEGHNITIISKPGVGHCPHSLSKPEQILRFILKADGLYENHAILPVRGNGYRSSPAGWLNGADWNEVAEDITVTLKAQKVDILMLGNSITQGASRNRKKTAGSRDLSPYFKEYSWESAGISGDKTQNLLWRLQTGEYNSAAPKYVSIAIGVNNLGADDDGPTTLEGILAVVKAAQKEFPDSKIILFGLLPTKSTEKRLNDYYWIQSELKKIEFDSQIKYVDPTPYFTDENGDPRKDIYRPDMIHLINKGYEVWCNLIYDTIKSL